jgi:4-hydroxybutyrate CoA-transferase
MTWNDEYKNKLVDPEEAVSIINSGDIVCIPIDTEPYSICSALLNRGKELENVTIMIRQPQNDLGWFKGDFGESFHVILDTQVGSAVKALNEKKVDYIPFLTSLRFKGGEVYREKLSGIDVALVVVSEPDKNGFCSFGMYLSHKRDYARKAKRVIAEVSDEPKMMVKVPGDNQIHISEIDCFVKHIPSPYAYSKKQELSNGNERIAVHVSSLIHDGDTIQMGPGSVISSLIPLGAFDNKNDLGVHSAIITPGIIDLVRRQIITGKQKSIDENKSVSGGFRRVSAEDDISFISGNPHFLVRDMSYVNDIRTIASQNNMVSINSVLSVDLTGQLAVDSLGTRMRGGAGGQVEFVIGSMLSKGGRSITATHSTAAQGKISCIVPTLDNGTIVSIPRTFCDYVVTEYGIARLWGKTVRERMAELISIAHPDFRESLRREADKLY